MAIVNKIKIGSTNYDVVGSVFYGSCSTAAGTAAKTVSVDGSFSLFTGATVAVKFTVTNTAANPTLNVSSTGAKAIYYNGAAISAGYLKANKVYQFFYNGTQWDLVGDIDTNTTYSTATTSAAGLMSAADKTKLNNTNIAYGTCSTAAATAAKVITISGNTNWTLTAGSLIMIKFTETNTAENPTFNVAGTGAKSVWYGSALITTSSLSYAGYANRPATYMYDGTQFVFVSWSYDTNTTYTNVKLGHGYATCSTAAATTAKTASLSSYTLTTGGIVAVKFTYDVPAGATLNINSKGAKNIYHKGAAITAGVIKAGDTATFIYSTRYHLISLDRDTSYSAATQSAAGLMSAADKTKLDGIATGANNYTYTLPNATSSVLGGVKVGSNISVSSGTISLTKANVTSALGYTPPTTNTTYSNATTSVAGLMSAADKTKLDGIAAGANNYTYTLPTASSTLGGVKTTSTVTSTSGLTACPIISGVPYYKDTNTTYTSLKNPYSLTIQGNGTTLTNGTYDGSAAKTVNITPSSIGAATANHIHAGESINPQVIELGSGASGHGGYIDFHYNGSTEDYTSRIIESSSGLLEVQKAWMAFSNGRGIECKDSAGNLQYLMFLSTSNTLWFGYDMPSTYTAKFGVPIAGTLHLNNTTDASSTADNAAPLIIGNRSGEHLVFDGNEIIPKSGAKAGGTLYLGDSESTVISISGKFRLNSYSYGTSLPAAGTAGRIFFKKV